MPPGGARRLAGLFLGHVHCVSAHSMGTEGDFSTRRQVGFPEDTMHTTAWWTTVSGRDSGSPLVWLVPVLVEQPWGCGGRPAVPHPVRGPVTADRASLG